MKRTAFILLVFAICLSTFFGCSQYGTAKHNTDIGSMVCLRMTLSYCNGDSIEISDEAVRTKLMAFLSKAGGTQGTSTKGHYGPHYSLRVYFEGEKEPLFFVLWNNKHYSTSKHIDSEGYQIFFKDDLTDFYQYLQEKYPAEFWLSGAVTPD